MTTVSSSYRQIARIKDSIESKVSLQEYEFVRLCQDHPELALVALNIYHRKQLPSQLHKFTIATLGYLPKHEDLLMKLVELDMCKEYPHLLHLACQCNFDRLVQMLIGRNYNTQGNDFLGNSPKTYAERNQAKFAASSDADANVQKRQNEHILEYLAKAE